MFTLDAFTLTDNLHFVLIINIRTKRKKKETRIVFLYVLSKSKRFKETFYAPVFQNLASIVSITGVGGGGILSTCTLL